MAGLSTEAWSRWIGECKEGQLLSSQGSMRSWQAEEVGEGVECYFAERRSKHFINVFGLLSHFACPLDREFSEGPGARTECVTITVCSGRVGCSVVQRRD